MGDILYIKMGEFALNFFLEHLHAVAIYNQQYNVLRIESHGTRNVDSAQPVPKSHDNRDRIDWLSVT